MTPIHIQQQWPTINWYQYLKIWEGLSDDMKHVASLVGVKEVFLIRAINQRITTRTAAQQAAMSIHLRFLISLALHDLVHEVPLPVVAEKFGTSKGLLQSLQLSAGGFAGMVTIFCQKLGWSNLELLFAQFQSRLVFGIERELCNMIRVSLLSNYQARTLYNAGYHTLTSLASASPTAVEVCLRSATPFHCAKTVEESQKTVTLKERLDEAEMIVKEAQRIISADLGISIESWQPKLSSQINKVESSETKRSQLKRSPLRETKSLKKIRLHLTSPDVTSTSDPMLSDIPPQAQSTPSLGKNDSSCSKVDHSTQIISPEQVMAQSPLLIDEVSCVKEEFSEVMFGEVSSTSCDMSVQLITPQVTDISVVAESPFQQSFSCDASGDVVPAKPGSSFESESILNVDALSHKEVLNGLMTAKSNVLDIAKHSSCCIKVKKITNKEVDRTIKEIAELQTVSISVATEAMKVGQGIGDHLRGHEKVQEMFNSLPVPLLHCDITGVAIYAGDLHVYYISVQSNDNLGEILSNCLCNCSSFRKKIIAFDIKKHAKLLSSGFNIDLSETALLDPGIAHWLTNPDGKQLSLPQLLSRHLPEVSNLSLEDASRKFSLSLKGNSNQLKAISECVTSFLLMNKLQDILVAEELYSPFVTIEMPSILCLAKMELNGVGICQEQCSLYKARLQNHLHKLEQKAHKLAEQKFSLSSPGEVARVLFVDLKLPVDDNRSSHSKFTMKQLSHISTCKEVLEKLSTLHPLPGVIMEWRTVAMTLGTVINPLEREIACHIDNDCVRIYATCHTHTATGRVTVAKPNLQSVPRDYQLCYEGDTSGPLPADQHTSVSIRNMFVAAPGCLLLSADYSQLELRIMAHLSGDECLKRALTGDQDVFKVMASDWLGIPLVQLTDQHRQQAKSICYGLMYGMGNKSLATQLKIPENEASDLVETFKNCYPGVKSFISDTLQLCKTKGYVVTIAGRKRFLPAIHSVNKSAQSQAERQAVNTVIQGSAADLIKMATISIDRHLKKANDCLTRLVLQLHDELLYECVESRTGEVSEIVSHRMSTVLKKSKINFPVKLKIGCSWGSLHTT